MALDTNIALGVKPIEQPNMLAQMGQMMQLRQAQQGFESENALRDFYAQGGDLSTAEGKRQLMSRAPGAGMKLIGQQSEISARDINTAEKSLAMMKNQAGLVRTPQDAANWLTSFYKNPLTRSYVESIAPLDQALAAIPNDPAGLETWLKRASLKADQIFTSADAELAAKTRIQAAGISAGPANARLAQEQRERAEADLLFGRPTTTAPVTVPMGGGGGVPRRASVGKPLSHAGVAGCLCAGRRCACGRGHGGAFAPGWWVQPRRGRSHCSRPLLRPLTPSETSLHAQAL